MGFLATWLQFGGTNEVICHLLPFAYKRSLPYLVEPLNIALALVCLCDFFAIGLSLPHQALRTCTIVTENRQFYYKLWNLFYRPSFWRVQ